MPWCIIDFLLSRKSIACDWVPSWVIYCLPLVIFYLTVALFFENLKTTNTAKSTMKLELIAFASTSEEVGWLPEYYWKCLCGISQYGFSYFIVIALLQLGCMHNEYRNGKSKSIKRKAISLLNKWYHKYWLFKN